MNKKLFTFISVSVSVALLVLICFQVYWIRKDYLIREELFKSKVDEALNVTNIKLEKLDPRSNYTKITERIQGIHRNDFKGKKNIGFSVKSEFSIDTNGHQVSSFSQNDLLSDSSIKFDASSVGFLKLIDKRIKNRLTINLALIL